MCHSITYSLHEWCHHDHHLLSHILVVHIEVVTIVTTEYFVEYGVVSFREIYYFAMHYKFIEVPPQVEPYLLKEGILDSILNAIHICGEAWIECKLKWII